MDFEELSLHPAFREALESWLQPPLIVGGTPRSPGWGPFQREWIREHGTCVACGGTKFLQVHHKKPYHRFPELELCKDNAMTLCMAPARFCHLLIGYSGDFCCWNPHAEEDAALMLLRRNERNCN
jgi:hypothetical protein